MKTITAKPPATTQHLRTVSGLSGSERVDKERHVIYGVALLQVGDLQEDDMRPWFVDETTVQQALSLGRAFPKGLKARWSHPNQSNDGLGKFVGRWRNLRLNGDGGTLLADLHLSRVAFRGGEESMGRWIEDMATDDPDAFGVSLAPVNDEAAMQRDAREDGKAPIRFRRLLAADVVDEPAATRGGLFGGELSIATAPAFATDFLNRLFGDAAPDVVRERVDGFVTQYLATRRGGHSPAMTGDSEMAQEAKVQGLTAEELTAALSTFGDKITGDILAKVDDKLAALKPAEPTDEEKAEAALAADRKRSNELYALAKNAGLSDWEDRAKGWVDSGLSVVEAKAALHDLGVAQNGLTKDAGEPADDPDAKYIKEYRAGAEHFLSMGLTQDEYVLSRKIEDGAESLSAA